jgi:hypothetical protein
MLKGFLHPVELGHYQQDYHHLVEVDHWQQEFHHHRLFLLQEVEQAE